MQGVFDTLYASYYAELADIKPLFSSIQNRVKYLMRLSAAGDKLSQTLHNHTTRNATTLVRLWAPDRDCKVAEVITTDLLYAGQERADIYTERSVFSLREGSYNFLAQQGEGFCMKGGAPVLDGAAPAIWHDGSRTVITPSNHAEAYPPAIDNDLYAFVLAKDAIHGLAATLDTIGSATVVNNFQFTNKR